jgi:ubiquinol-cytochrome c reductase cytochrome b subunit
MIKALSDWLDSRMGYRLLLYDALYEPIPGGAKWRYVWGSTLTFVFTVQLVSGVFLWMAYSPSTLTAWESVYYIQHEMAYGALVRGIHHYAAQAMMILLGLHFLQVVVDGAYRAPREINFWLGLILMQLVLGLALTGYLLPWDQKGYYATQVATNIAGVTPVIGPQIQQLAQGGTTYGHHTLTRFFALHAGVLPGLLIVFLGLHIYVFRRHGITVRKKDEGQPIAPFWPDQVLKDAVACLAVLATVLYLAVQRPAELAGPADPSEAFSSPRPEWYFLFLFRFLKFEAVDKLGLEFGAIYVPGAIMLIIALMPFIGRWKLGHGFNVAFVIGLLLGAGVLTGMALWEDAHDADLQAAMREAHADGERAVVLAREFGIPAQGVLSLLKDDPLTQGPRLFARKCASCHRYNGHDGTGRPIVTVEIVDHNKVTKDVPATAADLGKFGSRDWTHSVLVKYHEVFAPLYNAKVKQDDGTEVVLGERFQDMAAWSMENQEALNYSANAESVQALVEFLVQQSGRKDLGPIDEPKAAAGLEVFKSGTLASGSLSSACTDCHAMHVAGQAEALMENPGAGAPTLTGYAGKEWLTRFIQNPGHDDFYGEKNAMPVFADSMTEKEIRLLVDWLTGDYFQPAHAAN